MLIISLIITLLYVLYLFQLIAVWVTLITNPDVLTYKPEFLKSMIPGYPLYAKFKQLPNKEQN